MTLQRKFALLLATLALVVTVGLGPALWSVWILERELSGPLASIGPVLADLQEIKRGIDGQVRVLEQAGLIGDAPPADPDDPPGPAISPALAATQLAESNRFVRAKLAHLEGLDTYRVRAGLSTARTMRERIEAMATALDAWVKEQNPAALAAIAHRHRDARQLIERIEAQQVLNYTPAFLAFGGQLRARVLFILALSLTLMALTGVLALILMRRWVTQPVARLRDAAARIAEGDFAHRIRVEGQDELALLSAEVNHMAGTIASMQEERIEREKLAAVGEMVRRIAHNLRNPLAGIRSLAELTRSDVPAGSMPHTHQNRIVQTVDRFENWLKDLLSATAPLRIQKAPTAVAPWLERAIDPLRPMATARGIELVQDTAGAPAQADIDSRHLEQALVALVINAIQATPNGTRVEILARHTPQDGNTWELRVSDHGPGVPEGLQEKIFRPYFTTKRDGTGIGLALTRQVVEQHGGRIWVEPAHSSGANGQEGPGGAVFVIRLPLGGGRSAAEAGHNPPARGEVFGHHPGH